MEEELPKEDLPGVLPGWGTWKDQQREPRWVQEKRKAAEKAKLDAARARQDSKLKHVIISEKWDKKSAKYLTPSVPFPFTSKEVYESSMRQPMGRDFNTDASFRNMTRPAILKNAGTIINPIKVRCVFIFIST